MKTIKLLKVIPIFCMILILSACSKKNSADAIEQNTNDKAMLINAGKDFSIYEKQGSKLNSSHSNSQAISSATYKWRQVSGESVILSDNTVISPLFIAPDIEEDSQLIFELLVTDKNNLTSKDEVKINILDKQIDEKRQEIFVTDNSFRAVDRVVHIPYDYQQYPEEQNVSGLIIKLFWDNRELEFTGIDNEYTIDYQGYSNSKEDVSDEDNNINTNRYIIISWFNLENGVWELPQLPLKLFTPKFKTIGNEKVTHINIKSGLKTANLNLFTDTVEIRLK
jgi:hypothetical protein